MKINSFGVISSSILSENSVKIRHKLLEKLKKLMRESRIDFTARFSVHFLFLFYNNQLLKVAMLM